MGSWIIGIAVGILIIFIVWEFVTWYWKINDLVAKINYQTTVLNSIHKELTDINRKMSSQ